MDRHSVATAIVTAWLCFPVGLEAMPAANDTAPRPLVTDDSDTMVTGCLVHGRQPGTYRLERRNRSFAVTGKAVELGKHVGQRVQVTGVTLRARRPRDSRGPAGLPTLRANSVKRIQQRC